MNDGVRVVDGVFDSGRFEDVRDVCEREILHVWLLVVVERKGPGC